jgi:hypothetical protein
MTAKNNKKVRRKYDTAFKEDVLKMVAYLLIFQTLKAPNRRGLTVLEVIRKSVSFLMHPALISVWDLAWC